MLNSIHLLHRFSQQDYTMMLSQFGIKFQFNDEQRKVLSLYYDKDAYPSREAKEAISVEIGVSIKRVSEWFIDERKRRKKDRKSGGGGFL